jgi:hypothetical protein
MKKSGPQTFSQIVVPRPDRFLSLKFRPLLQSFLPDATAVAFTNAPLANNESEFQMTGVSATTAIARNRYSVLPLLTTKKSRFWFAVVFRFKAGLRDSRLINVSVVVFEGEAVNQYKTPLLRAEWDEWIDTSKHAQPHWHVYSSTVDTLVSSNDFVAGSENKALEDFGEEKLDPSGPTLSSSWLDADHFHFAMAAQWHSETTESHQVQLSEDGLLKWIEGCIVYTRDQLIYLS